MCCVKDQRQQEDLNKATEIKRLIEQHGTKTAHLIFYLRYLFRDNPSSRVIIFSQVITVLLFYAMRHVLNSTCTKAEYIKKKKK